eukprot:COSAG01_NODE_22325_length_860_cov_1.212878_1_plen_50_part_01
MRGDMGRLSSVGVLCLPPPPPPAAAVPASAPPAALSGPCAGEKGGESDPV